MDQLRRFFDLVESYCAARRMAEATLSTVLFNDGDKIAGLRAGKDVGTRRLARAMSDLQALWPADLAWPAHVPQPDPPPDHTAPASVAGAAGARNVTSTEDVT